MTDSVTCIFVHGWAMNSAVWDDCVTALPEWINVVVVDLPGHGTMAGVEAAVLDDYVQALIPLTHQPVIWVGWSLGGLAVLRLAELYPQKVAAALLVATNPCFVRKEDGQAAVEEQVFRQFADELNKDQQKTIRRFLSLQVKGLPDMMALIRQLQKSLQKRGQASTRALNTGLKILLESDLRSTLPAIKCPLYWLLGAKDTLVPAELARELEVRHAQKNVTLLAHASHAPFLSHTEDFVKQLIEIAHLYRK